MAVPGSYDWKSPERTLTGFRAQVASRRKSMHVIEVRALPMTAAVGSIEAYILASRGLSPLTQEVEFGLANRYRDDNDLDAARQLILSHLRLLISVARGYLGYWPNMADQSWAKAIHSYYGVLPYWDDHEWTGPHTGER